MPITVKSDLFIPEVVGDKMETAYNKFITVSKFLDVDTTLVARPGDTLTLNRFNYIGDANVLAEATDDVPVKLTSAPVTKTVVKVSKQVQISDEAIMSGMHDPYGEAVDQIAFAIASKDDADAITEMATTTVTATGTTLAEGILNGRKALGERGTKKNVYAFVNSADYFDMVADYKNWIPASEISTKLVQKGVLGQYLGVNVVLTDTVTAGAPYLMLEGAMRKIMKRGFLAERDRDLANYTWLLAGSEHRVQYLYDPLGVVAVTI